MMREPIVPPVMIQIAPKRGLQFHGTLNGKNPYNLCLSLTKLKCVNVPKNNNYALKRLFVSNSDHQIELESIKYELYKEIFDQQSIKIQLVLERKNKKNKPNSVSILQPILLHWNDV